MDVYRQAGASAAVVATCASMAADAAKCNGHSQCTHTSYAEVADDECKPAIFNDTTTATW